MGRVIDNPKSLSTQQLLNFADRSDPVVRELCARLEVYCHSISQERTKRNEFKRELSSLMGMLD